MSSPRLRRQVDPHKIIDRRLALGFSQKRLAELALMSQSMLCDIENGRRNGSPETHRQLAKALRLRRISDLYNEAAA